MKTSRRSNGPSVRRCGVRLWCGPPPSSHWVMDVAGGWWVGDERMGFKEKTENEEEPRAGGGGGGGLVQRVMSDIRRQQPTTTNRGERETDSG